MASRAHPPGYHCSKALRALGLESEAITRALKRQLALDTGEIEEVLAFPITPPEGFTVDLSDMSVDVRFEPDAGISRASHR
jgi:hypothetical protein